MKGFIGIVLLFFYMIAMTVIFKFINFYFVGDFYIDDMLFFIMPLTIISGMVILEYTPFGILSDMARNHRR